ncbi:MAG: hypothetical protein Kow0070_10540 [Anaerolineales bacterium]
MPEPFLYETLNAVERMGCLFPSAALGSKEAKALKRALYG